MRKVAVLYLVIIVLSMIIGVGIFFSFKYLENNNRLKNNVDALFSETETYKTENNELAYRNKIVTISLNEARQLEIPELQREIENLNIKLRHVQTYTNNAITIVDTFRVPIYDTVIFIDTVSTLVKAFNYADPFTIINGKIYNDSIDIDYQVTDTIIQVVTKGKYNKWYDPLLFRRRPLEQIITAKNPKTKIVYSRIIKIRE